MPFVVEENELSHPVPIGRFGTVGIMVKNPRRETGAGMKAKLNPNREDSLTATTEQQERETAQAHHGKRGRLRHSRNAARVHD
jgi:hypothetical protein